MKYRWNKLSFEAQEIIKDMTHVNPDFRPTISEILTRPWLTNRFGSDLLHEIHCEMSYRKGYMLNLFEQAKYKEQVV